MATHKLTNRQSIQKKLKWKELKNYHDGLRNPSIPHAKNRLDLYYQVEVGLERLKSSKACIAVVMEGQFGWLCSPWWRGVDFISRGRKCVFRTNFRQTWNSVQVLEHSSWKICLKLWKIFWNALYCIYNMKFHAKWGIAEADLRLKKIIQNYMYVQVLQHSFLKICLRSWMFSGMH